MSDLIERCIDAIDAIDGLFDRRAVARAVAREVLAALCPPSPAMLDAVAAGKPWIGHPEARPESVARYHEGVREAGAADMATMIRAFAREHGLETPRGGPQEPGTGGLGPGSVKDAPEPGTAPGGPLAARGTPGGDAP